MSANKFRDYTRYRNNAVTNTLILVRSGQGTITGLIVNNPNASEAFLQIFDAASTGAVTLGTTVCDEPIKIPASGSITLWGTEVKTYFDNGLVIAATTTEGGSTAPASALSVVLRYQ